VFIALKDLNCIILWCPISFNFLSLCDLSIFPKLVIYQQWLWLSPMVEFIFDEALRHWATFQHFNNKKYNNTQVWRRLVATSAMGSKITSLLISIPIKKDLFRGTLNDEAKMSLLKKCFLFWKFYLAETRSWLSTDWKERPLWLSARSITK